MIAAATLLDPLGLDKALKVSCMVAWHIVGLDLLSSRCIIFIFLFYFLSH